MSAAPVVALMIVVSGCQPTVMDDRQLLSAIEMFDEAVRGQPRTAVRQMLREHADTFIGSVVEVELAVVASPYVRENESSIYFGVGYDPQDHLFLSEIDPRLDETLRHHRHWVSVVKTYPSRQLSYELAVDEPTFDLLQPGQDVSFKCRIAALIRGKSVYCLAEAFHIRQDP